MRLRRPAPTRDEVLHVTKKLAQQKGEKLGIHDVRAKLSIHSRLIDEYFGSWAELRKLVGLKRARAPLDKVFSDEELLSEYRRIAIECGRPPSAVEYERKSGHRWKTLILRFGSREAVHRRVRLLDEYVRAFESEELFTGKARLAFDEDVLRRSWERVRVGFALYASDARDAQGKEVGPDGGPSFPFDLLIVAVDDWPMAPMPVLQLSDLLPDWSRWERGEG